MSPATGRLIDLLNPLLESFILIRDPLRLWRLNRDGAFADLLRTVAVDVVTEGDRALPHVGLGGDGAGVEIAVMVFIVLSVDEGGSLSLGRELITVGGTEGDQAAAAEAVAVAAANGGCGVAAGVPVAAADAASAVEQVGLEVEESGVELVGCRHSGDG